MNNERIEFALKILAWEVDAARKRIHRRRKKLHDKQEIAAHLLGFENRYSLAKEAMKSFKAHVKSMQRIENKEAANMKWRKGKDPRNVAGRNQMIVAYGRKRSS